MWIKVKRETHQSSEPFAVNTDHGIAIEIRETAGDIPDVFNVVIYAAHTIRNHTEVVIFNGPRKTALAVFDAVLFAIERKVPVLDLDEVEKKVRGG